MPVCMIYVIFKDQAQARNISQILVQERLVACANIFPAHESLYWWDGAVQNTAENAVIYKTRFDNFAAVRAKILELHSYECPCIVALPIEQGHEDFLKWVDNMSSRVRE
jgi:periplasmic divalent cation tolerance protein